MGANPDCSSSSQITVALPDDLCNALAELSERTERSTSQMIEQAVRRFLDENKKESGSIYLSAPVSALIKGIYEENTTIAEILKNGDFGIGTFNDLDGEMLMLDGTVYQLKADGHTYEVAGTVQTPFACVTFFHPTTVDEVDTELEYAGFKSLLYRLVPSTNMLYAIRIDGNFKYVQVWSALKQENYKPLAEVATEMFEYRDVEGTIVGFYTPEFLKSLSMPGYHLHFLTADRKHGGHLHQCGLKNARISVQFITKLRMDLPITLDYLTANLKA